MTFKKKNLHTLLKKRLINKILTNYKILVYSEKENFNIQWISKKKKNQNIKEKVLSTLYKKVYTYIFSNYKKIIILIKKIM